MRLDRKVFKKSFLGGQIAKKMSSVQSGIIWAIISGALGLYLGSIGWTILSYIALAFCGLSVYTVIRMISGGRF